MNFKHLISELKRRNVFKVAMVYAITGWLVIQVATSVFPVLLLPSWLTRAVVVLVLIGFPIAIIIAWAFELTPDGVKRTEEVQQEQSITKTTGKKLNNILLIVLILAVIVLSYKVFFTKQPVAEKSAAAATTSDSLTAPAKSIAVLPFENMSSDSNNVYFANGMQDMILTKLADIGDLKVISRTSTEKYKSHPDNLKTIANELGVGTILEGSVQKAGKQVLINVQLINAQSDDHIWAESYTRNLDNIFGVEGEVAQKIATALKARLDPAEQAQVAAVPTHNPAAYDAYLRGLSLQTSSTPRDYFKADSDYTHAVKLDPDFTLAWAHLSSTKSFSYFSNINHTPAELAEAKQALDHAMALAPNVAATQIAAGDYYYHGLLDYDNASAAYRKALKISPNNAEATADLGFVERRKGHWQTAIDYLKRSIALDPRNVLSIVNLGSSFLAMRNYTAAEELFQQALAINPDDEDVTMNLATVYLSKGNTAQVDKIITGSVKSPEYLAIWAGFNRHYSDATHLMRKALAKKGLSKQTQGNYYSTLGFFEQLAGNHEASLQAFRQAVSILKQVDHWSDNPSVLSDLSEAQSGLGEKDAALATAKRAIALYPTSRDAFAGPEYELNLAQVQAWVGDKTQAIATLKRLMAMPPGSDICSRLSPAFLRMSPFWNPLKKEPGFQALLSKYGSQDQETGEGS